jgi:hypothetical protein
MRCILATVGAVTLLVHARVVLFAACLPFLRRTHPAFDPSVAVPQIYQAIAEEG